MSEMGKLAEKLKRGRRKARKAEREGKAEPRSQVGKALPDLWRYLIQIGDFLHSAKYPIHHFVCRPYFSCGDICYQYISVDVVIFVF